MPVPLAVVHGDDSRTGLDEAACGEKALRHAWRTVFINALHRVARTVAFEAAWIFFGKIKRVCEL